MAAKQNALDKRKLKMDNKDRSDTSNENEDEEDYVWIGQKKNFKPVIIRNRLSKLIQPSALNFDSKQMNDTANVETQNTELKDMSHEKQ